MDDAEQNPAIRFIVTFGHRPAYSSGYHAGDAGLAAILDSLGDTHAKYVLNLDGHSHDYERTFPQHGVTHVTVGTGGSTLEQLAGPCPYAGGCPRPAWSAFRAYHHGALALQFTSSAIKGTAVCGPPGDSGDNLDDVTCSPGSTFDQFTIGVDHPPVVTTPANATAVPGQPVALTVTAVDPDGDRVRALVADLAVLPPGNNAVFAVAPGDSTALLTWTPAAGDTGTFTIPVRAANSLTGSALLTLTVADTLAPPPPGVARLAIAGIRPNPAAGPFGIAYELPSAAPARLELVDARGRVVLRRDLGTPGAGLHTLQLDPAQAPTAGLYWVRVVQGARSTSSRLTLLR